MAETWQKLRDCYKGEAWIKAVDTGDSTKARCYLPATPGQLIDGMLTHQDGYKNYLAYKKRARFPNYVKRAVEQMVGAMHSQAAVIELPPAMEPLRTLASTSGESLSLLLRRINAEQLTVGRVGLMSDMPKGKTLESMPAIALYSAETITNWNDGQRGNPVIQSLNLVVLNETEKVMNANFEWVEVIKYRVLVIGDVTAAEPMGVYRQGVFLDANGFDENGLMEPKLRGKTLNKIPFVFINATDLVPCPQMPPMDELADLCLTIYRGEADYRQGLFAQSQDTLVVPGGDPETTYRIGYGATICPPLDAANPTEFIGTNSAGLPEQRQALENDRNEAKEIAGQMLDTSSRQKESGEALKVRVAAQTVTLKQIALTGGEGLQSMLRIIAEWMGADPAKVNVFPNTEFVEAGMTPAEFLDLQSAREKGLPLSDESVHDLLVENEFTDKKFVAEMAKVMEEKKAKMELMPQPVTGQPPDVPASQNGK
jgi:hypothetical protein